MGHAIHFLERINRLNEQETEQAMALYKNAWLVKIILDEINPPESFERMAISLAHGEKGPYIIVTRGGRFVTCLGKGMSTGKCYVIRHEHFEVYRKRMEMLIGRTEYLFDVMNDYGEDETPDTLIIKRGATMSREDFLAVSAFQPLMKQRYIVHVTRVTELLADVQMMAQNNGTIWDDEGMSEIYWNYVFALGHLSALSSMFGPKGLEPLADWNESGVYPLYSAFHCGQMMNGARALFAAARMGSCGLQVCEVGVEKYHSTSMWLFSVWSAAVIGARHKRLASRVKKILTPNKAFLANADNQTRDAYSRCLSVARMAVENANKAYENGASMVRERLYRDSCQNGFSVPYSFQSVDDVPNDLAFSYSVNLLEDFRCNEESARLLSACLVWISRAEAEDLYLPKDLLRQINNRWQPEYTEYLLNAEKMAKV